jgi:hypothetical protein
MGDIEDVARHQIVAVEKGVEKGVDPRSETTQR